VLTLDIRTEVGRERCLEIADHADVVVEGFRPGVMERWGLGPGAASLSIAGALLSAIDECDERNGFGSGTSSRTNLQRPSAPS
jgi:hypothetical protein